MPREFRNTLYFPYPWRETVIGILDKYPNPQAEHVKSMDIIDQKFDEETGLLRLERILGVRQGAPRWAMRLLGGREDTFVREVTMVDPSKNLVEMTSTNMTLSQVLLVKEYITYTPTALHSSGLAAPEVHPGAHHDANSTVFSQTALIESQVSGVFSAAARKMEDWSHSRFGDNAAKGKKGLMTVLYGLWGPPRQASAITSAAPRATESGAA